MGIMAVDWGEKRVGVALADDGGLDVRPLRILERRSDDQVLDELAGIVKEWEVGRIVVGAPFNMDGSEGPQFERVRKVALRIEGRLRRPVLMVDERLTSREAGLDTGRGGPLKDDLAAAAILGNYFSNPSGAFKPASRGSPNGPSRGPAAGDR